ncbi:MAG: hypothetical protein HY035_03750 [Nitrospirae bacterium]|nr:hypothetical protein [Nitrospirota bacterium]MBI3377503.1 hypothetical protein [Nitrospirota bacterium]
MDSDCLVKLTKSGAKEAIVSVMEVHIPPLVKKETVDEAKERGYQDAFIIEENIDRKVLQVVKHEWKKSSAISATKGEAEVISLYLGGNYDAIASDDQRFLKRLEAANIPYLTATACLVYLYKNKKVERSAAVGMLESLKPFISRDEYAVAKLYMEEKS